MEKKNIRTRSTRPRYLKTLHHTNARLYQRERGRTTRGEGRRKLAEKGVFVSPECRTKMVEKRAKRDKGKGEEEGGEEEWVLRARCI